MIAKNFTGWHDLTSADYHSIKEAVGSTSLKKVLESPLEYQYYINAPREDKSTFDFGTAMHSVVLEQDATTFICGPDVNKNTKEWKEAKAKAQEDRKIILDPEQYADVMRGFEMFCAHPIAHKLVSQCQYIEKSGFYLDQKSGLWCQFRPDGYCANDTHGDYIFDYKTARSITQHSIDSAIAEYGYHISAAHYIEGVKAVTGREIKHFYMCFQKNNGSMDVVVKLLDEESIRVGKDLRDKCLMIIADCKDKGAWPGLSDSIEACGLPAWAVSKAAEFITKEVV
jgi:hypothetical protein